MPMSRLICLFVFLVLSQFVRAEEFSPLPVPPEGAVMLFDGKDSTMDRFASGG